MSLLRFWFRTIALVGLGVPLWGTPAGTPTVQRFAMPRYFEPNWGVADPAIQYVSRGARYQAMFTKEGASFALDGAVVQLRFEGAGPFRYEAVEPLASKSHYIAQKVSNVPHYRRLRARGIYPGIDIEFYPKDGEIEFDLIVAPGADPGQIRMKFPGSTKLAINDSGELLVFAGKEAMRVRNPVAHQGERGVAAAFRVGDGVVGFDLGPYDPAAPLVIDPVLDYMTFNFWSQNISGHHSITADSTAVYVAAHTTTSYPVTTGAWQTTPPPPGQGLAFVAKFSADGTQLLYASYLGGNPGPTRVVLSRTGEVYVLHAGELLPTPGTLSLPSVAQTLVRLNESGSAATLVLKEYANEIAFDRNGDLMILAYRVGQYAPAISPGAYNQPDGGCQILKVNRAGTTVLWSVRYGGRTSGGAICSSMVLDSQDRVWVSGFGSPVATNAAPTTPDALWATTTPSRYFGFFGRISADGTQLQYSSYTPQLLEGDFGDRAILLAIGPGDDLYLKSTSYEVAGTPGAYIRSPLGKPTFVLRMSPAGVLRFLTFLPVAVVDAATAPFQISPDSAGNFTVVGSNGSSAPLLDGVTADALAGPGRGGGYVLTMNGTGSDVLYATYLPTAPDEIGGITAAATDGAGKLYFAGRLLSQLLVPTRVSVVQGKSTEIHPATIKGFFGKINLQSPSPSCSYSILSNPPATLPVEGGTGQVTVLTGAECPWQLDSLFRNNFLPSTPNSAHRLVAAPNLALGRIYGGAAPALATGVGPGTVTFRFDPRVNFPNPGDGTSDWETTFRLFGFYTSVPQPQTLTVTQPYIPCSILTLLPAAASLAAAGSAAFTDLDLPPACTWTAASSAPWLSLNRTSGAGGGRLSFSVATNLGAARSATISIATAGPSPNVTRVLHINQSAGATVPTLALSAPAGSFPAAATTGSVDVLTQPGITWNAYANQPWVTITSPHTNTNTGPGSVTFSLLANPETTPRLALLTIGGQIYTVSQLGLSCLYGLTPTNTVVAAPGGAGSFTVGRTAPACPISPTSSVPWLAVSSVTGTTGNFTTAANPNPTARTGSIRIADQAFTVTQAGAACTYSLPQSTQTFFSSAGSGSVALVTQGGCPWVAGSSASWATVTSPANNSGPATVTFTLAANPNPGRRTTTLFLGGQNFIIVQAGTNEGSCTASIPSLPTVNAEGLSELTGELLLSCTDLPAAVDTHFELALNVPITNNLPVATLTLNNVLPRFAAPNRLRWTGLRLPAGSSVLRVAGLRANAAFLGRPGTFEANPIRASLQFSVPLTITNPSLPIAQAAQTVVFSTTAFNRPSGSPLAASLVQFRETLPDAIQPGARLRIVVSNLPANAELLLPVGPADGSTRARLLSAAADGSGGVPLAANRINGTYYLATPAATSYTVTWEVLTANAAQAESFDFQLLVGNMLPADLPAISVVGGLGPLSLYRNPVSLARRTNLRLTTQIVTPTGGTSSAKGPAPRALFTPGSRILLQQTLTNESQPGEPPAANTLVRNNLPAGLLLRACPSPCTAIENQPVFSLGNVAAGQSQTVSFEVEVGPGLADGTPLTAFGSAASEETPVDLAAASSSTTILVGGVPLSLVLTPGALTVPGTAGTAQIQLTTAFPTLPWTATVTSGANWLTLLTPSGTGSGTLQVSFPANPDAAPRQATIAVGAATVTMTQSPAPPSVTATGPLGAIGATNSFVFRFSHPGGFQNLGVVNALINRALDGGSACYIAYSVPAGVLFLVNDAGPAAGLSAPLVLGSATNVANSQCQINGTGSSVVGSGNVLTLTLNITFRPAFAGNQVVYLAARDQGTGNSGWSTQGFHTVPGAAVTFPNAVGMSPATGSASTATMTFTYDDQTNASNIRTAWALINTAVDAGRACYVAFFNPGSLVLLLPDDGDGNNAQVLALGGAGSVENSQCRISGTGSTVIRVGGRLTLTLNVTFKPGFAGNKGVWIAAQTLANVTSAWKVAGAWQVPP